MRNSTFAVRLCAAAALTISLAVGLSARREAQDPPPAAGPPSDTLVYADFETMDGGRPVSSRGGTIFLRAFAENETLLPTFKGLAGLDPPGPELVRIKPDDPNRLAKFEFELKPPNQYAGVILEVNGHPEKDGRAVSDDVSGYKNFAVQVFATGIETMHLEMKSRGFGMDRQQDAGWPQVTFKPTKGLNTYRIQLKTFSQPSWVTDTRYDPKDLLKKLTAVSISPYCDECRPMTGMVVIDNMVFEK